jgi:hypothetical protein
MVEDYKINILSLNSVALLKKALEKGEILFIDCIIETQMYSEAEKEILEAGKNLHRLVSDLMQWEL